MGIVQSKTGNWQRNSITMKVFLLPKWLLRHQLLEANDAQALQKQQANLPPNLFLELNLLLYGSILAFLSGLGTIIYYHIDKTGHLVLMALLFAASAWGYRFCMSTYPAYAHARQVTPSHTAPYVLLLAYLLFSAGVGYVVYQFQLFGNDHTLPSLLIGLAGVVTAYRFDDERTLSLGLTGIAAAFGFSLFRWQILTEAQWMNPSVWATGFFLGVLFTIAGWWLAGKQIKPHFENVYANLAAWLMLLSNFLLLFELDEPVSILFLVFAVLVLAAFFKYSQRLKSVPLYCLTLIGSVLTMGAGLTRISWISELLIMLGLYFVLGAIVLTAYFIIHYKKYLKL